VGGSLDGLAEGQLLESPVKPLGGLRGSSVLERHVAVLKQVIEAVEPEEPNRVTRLLS
jgi:hypothetical protein